MDRRALTALLLLLPIPTLAVLAAMLWLPESGLGQILFMLSKLWILLLPLIWRKFVEGHPLSLSPARHGGWAPALWTGVGIAMVILGAFFVVRHLGWIDEVKVRERAELTGLDHPAIFIGAALYWITFNSLMEEYVWRWFVFRQFEKLIGGKLAVVASALGFTLHHIFAVALQFDWRITLLASTGVFAGGLIWSWLYLRYRSVWPCYLSHAIVDVPIFVAGWIIIFG
ncbi:MAG: CPBP family intramembrane glutamic endopeptidase [Akkermansiaceae bacterium]|nr:CPBP family intramembrane glutamic endopeptidase [Akkermansiaceae bacterium]